LTEEPTGSNRYFGTLSDGIAAGGLVLVIGVVSVVLLVVGVVGSVVYIHRDSSDALTTKALTTNNGDPLISDSERAKVKAVAEQFCLRMDDVDTSDPEAYTKNVKELLTTKLKAAFDQQFDAVNKLETDKTVKGVGTVLASGIADIDPDSATVLVAHDTAVTSSSGDVQRHARWTVSLRKINGRWLVDNWNPAS
jgi:Mce-associated membrane protein